MDLECFKLTKQNKSGRERQIYDFTHTWNLRNKDIMKVEIPN